MDLTSEESITDEIPAVAPGMATAGHYPLENPRIDVVPDDPLSQPHPSEPGVGPDGEAAPLENPDDSFALDPLVRAGTD
jgi:hypothetical protein